MSIRAALLIAALGGAVVLAQEKGTITTPVSQPSLQEVEIVEVRLGRLPTWLLAIYYVDNLGKVAIDYHTGPDAQAMVIALNKANLSTKSLECRAIEHLVTHEKIPAATCTGSPQ